MSIGSAGAGNGNGNGSGNGDGGVGVPNAFTPFEESGSLAKSESKAFSYDVPAGTYRIDMTGTGDADLYVRKDQAPTKTTYDCRPFKSGSAETCTVTFAAAGKLHVMVNGYATQSTFALEGTKP
jgi:hypothetical protein